MTCAQCCLNSQWWRGHLQYTSAELTSWLFAVANAAAITEKPQQLRRRSSAFVPIISEGVGPHAENAHTHKGGVIYVTHVRASWRPTLNPECVWISFFLLNIGCLLPPFPSSAPNFELKSIWVESFIGKIHRLSPSASSLRWRWRWRSCPGRSCPGQRFKGVEAGREGCLKSFEGLRTSQRSGWGGGAQLVGNGVSSWSSFEILLVARKKKTRPPNGRCGRRRDDVFRVSELWLLTTTTTRKKLTHI